MKTLAFNIKIPQKTEIKDKDILDAIHKFAEVNGSEYRMFLECQRISHNSAKITCCQNIANIRYSKGYIALFYFASQTLTEQTICIEFDNNKEHWLTFYLYNISEFLDKIS